MTVCAAPLFGDETEVGELLLDPFGVGVGLVDLVDRDKDGNTRRFGVVDRLLGLRHHAVVGGHHQDDDVGDARAARAHHRERFVAGRVEEDDVAIVDLDRVGADVLGDAAGLALSDARRTDGVEQRRLAVVDVAHDRDDRRACDDVLGTDILGFDLQHLLFEGLHLDVGAEFAGDHRRGLVVERAVDRHHQPPVHQLAQHVLRLDVELGGEIGDRHPFGQRDRPRDRGRRRGRRCRHVDTRRVVTALTATGAAAAKTWRRRAIPWCRSGSRRLRGPDGLRRERPGAAHRRLSRRQHARDAAAGGRSTPGPVGGAGRAPAAGRLKLPVGACEAAGAADAGGRTSTGRRGGAGGAWPVFGSSTRSRSVGGTTRPVDGGITGRGGAGVSRVRSWSGFNRFFEDWFRHAGSNHRFFSFDRGLGDRRLDGGDGLGNRDGFRDFVDTTRHIRDVGSARLAVLGVAASASRSGGGAAGLAVFTSRGGGNAGVAGRCGSGALPAGFLPRTAAGASANEALDGTVMLRWRASRSTNWRATTSSIVLEALFTSIP